MLSSTIGQLKRMNIIVSSLFVLYALFQALIAVIWLFYIVKIRKYGAPLFEDASLIGSTRIGFWFSVVGIVCQLIAGVLRLLITVITVN